jgi:D-alanyl-D-alanine carboxypeptidase
MIAPVIFVLVTAGGCAVSGKQDSAEVARTQYPKGMAKEQQMESLMRAHIVHRGTQPVHNFLLLVDNEPADLTVHKGVGTIGRNDTPIDAEYQYNVASITKVLVAAIILQLEEEGKLKLGDPAGRYLEDLAFVNYDQFHVLDGVSYSAEITIKDLLQHRTGIGDIFTDVETRFNINVLLHRKRQYSPERIVATYYRYRLNESPFFRPGEGYHYSDVNYVLLGLIVEQVTGGSLSQQIRARILEPLDMDDTYFEFYEPVHGSGKRIDAYLGPINITRYINTSYEWAGGGLVSTTEDMATFIQALFELELYDDPATLQKMLDNSDNEADGETYALGINEYALNGEIYYGHGGFYGSLLAYHPEKRITLSANIGQATPPFDTEALVEAILEIVTAPE